MSTGGLLRSIALFIVLLLLCLVAGVTFLSGRDRAIDYPATAPDLLVPKFDTATIDFIPAYDQSKTIPFAAGAVVDIDNDGVDEVFLGGGTNQQDAIYQFQAGEFVDITAQTEWEKTTPDKTFSAVSLDLDKNGDNDLLVTRDSGVFVYYNVAGKFTAKKLALELDAETVPLSVAVSDLNRDGLYDIYVSGYIGRAFVQGETIFNKDYGGVSALFINKGNDSFEDVTKQAGLYYKHNTFQSIFIDIDNDGLEDLVVAHDTGQVRTWRNNGDLTFDNISNPSTDVFTYPMGIAVTDLANDGNPDFFFSNVGSTVPTKLVRGDLRVDQTLVKEWMLFKNNGNFKFEDTAEAAQLARYEFSWGAVFEDFNLDGLDDLVVSENYEGWPLHKLAVWRLDGRFLLQTADEKFIESGAESGVRNRQYGISPLVSDFNQDGYPDLIHVNLLGPQKVFLSQGGDQGYLKVKLANTVESVGAKVSVSLDDGSTLVQYFIVGEGLCSDQSHVLTFGLGDRSAKAVNITRLNGEPGNKTGNFRNELLSFK